ncbi:MAG: DUF4424 family protein, partial [Alphaproteobacteria bacterium]|nr:DUF4424 family protein [Alphaproteobacteria bacterium]
VSLGAGGLVPRESPDVSMESEDLDISVREIKIRYVFRNHSSQDIDATVAFPLPALDGQVISEMPISLPDENNSNFVDFKAFVQGKEIPVKMDIRAFKGDEDLTPRLLSAGLPATVLTRPLQENLLKLPAGQRAQLEREGLIVKRQGLAEKETGPGWSAKWEMRVQYYWRQFFPKGQAIELVQSYRPVVGGGIIEDPAQIEGYCADPQTAAQAESLRKKLRAAGAPLFGRTVLYTLTTARNWRGPIGTFRLSVKTDNPDDIVLSCFPPLKKVSPTVYEARISDFRPDEDLILLILQKPDGLD